MRTPAASRDYDGSGSETQPSPSLLQGPESQDQEREARVQDTWSEGQSSREAAPPPAEKRHWPTAHVTLGSVLFMRKSTLESPGGG